MLEKILSRCISKKYSLILSELASQKYRSKTDAIWKVSRKLKIPESTVRWNVNRMISIGLLESNGSLVPTSLAREIVKKKLGGEKNGTS